MATKKPLFSLKEMAFCNEYMLDKNTTQAAIRAGFNEKSARTTGYHLLRKSYIKAELERRMNEQIKRLQLTADTVLVELLTLAKVDIRKAYNPDGTLKQIHEIPEDVARAIASVEVEEQYSTAGSESRKVTGYIKKLRLIDKNQALTNLARHFKLITDNAITGPVVINQMGHVTINGAKLEYDIGHAKS